MTPLQQRRLAKILSQRPEDLAIIQGAVNSKEFANDEMRRYLRDFGIKNQQKAQTHNLGIQRDRLSLDQRRSDFAKQSAEADLASKARDMRRSRVPGYLNVGLSGVSAYNQINKSDKLSEQIGYLVDRQNELTGLYSGNRFTNSEASPENVTPDKLFPIAGEENIEGFPRRRMAGY